MGPFWELPTWTMKVASLLVKDLVAIKNSKIFYNLIIGHLIYINSILSIFCFSPFNMYENIKPWPYD